MGALEEIVSSIRRPKPHQDSAAGQDPAGGNLADIKRRLDDLTRLVSDWVWETDRNFRLTFVSDRVLELLGYHPYEMLNQSFSEVGSFHFEKHAPHEIWWQSPFRDVMFEVTDRYGKQCFFLVSGLPIFNLETGAFEAVRGTARDITGRLQSEKQLREAHDALEIKVDERTRLLSKEITERKKISLDLILAKEEAELANRTKSEFLANMCHELRTPLNAIIGFSEAIQHKIFGPLGGDGKYDEYVIDIRDSGTHLLGLINDILDLSTVETGMVEMTEEAFDPGLMIEECLRMVKSKANEAGLSLRAVDLPQNTLLSGDRLRIKQVVLNLLSNAIKFTDRGGEISVQAQREEDGSLAIAVADTGIGMAVEDVPQAFAQFGQIDMVDSRSQGGVGLGLYLCRRYMELHDGTIEVKSKPDKGTRITIRFPRARAICSLRESAAL